MTCRDACGGKYGYDVWNCQREIAVTPGLPSLVSANGRTTSRR